MSFSADIKRMQEQLKAAGQVLPKAGITAAKLITGLLQDEFTASRDPYGQTWAELKVRAGRPLVATGALMSETRAEFRSPSSIVASVEDYGVYHQFGTSNVPQRKIIPDDTTPSSWEKTIQDSLDTELRQVFGEGT